MRRLAGHSPPPLRPRYDMSSFISTLLFIAAVTVPSVVAADESDGRVTNYGFDDEQVFGDHPSPDGEVLRARTRERRESLIRARVHFIPELFKSVENL